MQKTAKNALFWLNIEWHETSSCRAPAPHILWVLDAIKHVVWTYRLHKTNLKHPYAQNSAIFKQKLVKNAHYFVKNLFLGPQRSSSSPLPFQEFWLQKEQVVRRHRGTYVGRYLWQLGMPPLTKQEEGLTNGTFCTSHCPMSGLRLPKQVHFCTAMFLKKKDREMWWVISVIYPVFLGLIFHHLFFSKKRYFFQDVATNWAPLYYCVLWYVNKEGYATMHCTTCRLIRLFSATDCEASQYKDLISVVLPKIERMQGSHKGNYDKEHSSSNARPRIPDRYIRKTWSFANRNARPRNNVERNNKMGRSTNYTACAFPLMRRYCMGAHTGPATISSFHTVVTVGFTAQ